MELKFHLKKMKLRVTSNGGEYILMTDKEKLLFLAESNMELSIMLLEDRKDAKNYMISYLFGCPLTEIYDILLDYEKQNG